MALAVTVTPGKATLAPSTGGAVLVSVVSAATLAPAAIGNATLTAVVGNAAISTTPFVAIALTGSAVVGSNITGGPPFSSQDVGTSFVDFATVA